MRGQAGRPIRGKRVANLEVFLIGFVSHHCGELGHGVDADDALQREIGLKSQPAGEIIRGNCLLF